MSVEEYWGAVFILKNSAGIEIFPKLKEVFSFLLVLPFSNASVERVFSALKQIKTDKRNRLSTDLVSAVIFTKEGIKENGGTNFEPDKKLYNLSWR